MPNHRKTIIRRATEGFTAWCADNSPAAKLERTIVDGLIGIACAGLSAAAGAPEWAQVWVAPAVMAVLSPVKAKIGESFKEA